MPQLTNTKRNYVRGRIVAYAFENREASLRKREVALVTEAIRSLFGVDAFERFSSVPEGWLPIRKTVYLTYRNTTYTFNLDEARPLPMNLASSSTEIKNQWIGAKLIALANDRTALARDREKLHGEIDAQLRSITTLAQLKEMWPEAYSYLATPDPGPNYPVPAPRLEDLKKRIDELREAA